jgi:hypothetical protein
VSHDDPGVTGSEPSAKDDRLALSFKLLDLANRWWNMCYVEPWQGLRSRIWGDDDDLT